MSLALAALALANLAAVGWLLSRSIEGDATT